MCAGGLYMRIADEVLRMRKMITLALLVSGIAQQSAAQTVYSKCRTVNGTVIVVSGMQCPMGTVWVGRA
jgi:hypothetical protein